VERADERVSPLLRGIDRSAAEAVVIDAESIAVIEAHADAWIRLAVVVAEVMRDEAGEESLSGG